MYGDEGVLTTFLIAGAIGNLLSFLLPLAIVFFIFRWIKKPQPPQYPPGILALQQLLQVLIQSAGPLSSGQRSEFINTFHQAQNEVNQLDSLRQQQSELRLGDIRAEAASMGIFLD